MSVCLFVCLLLSLFIPLLRFAFLFLPSSHNHIFPSNHSSHEPNYHPHKKEKHSSKQTPHRNFILKPGAEGRRHRQQVLHLFALLHRLHDPSIHILLPLLQRRQIHVRRQPKASLHKRIHIARREVPRLSHHHGLQQQPHIIPLENLRVHLQHLLVPLERLRLIARLRSYQSVRARRQLEASLLVELRHKRAEIAR